MQNMADRDLLDYLNEQDLSADRTPNRRLGMRSSSGSGQSSVRKSGKFRKLYTPNKSSTVDGNTETNPEPCPKRMRLSSASHNATFGNGSHIDSSFDVVEVTPDINRLQSSTFQLYSNNHISVPEGNLKVTPKSMQQCDSVNRSDSETFPSPLCLKINADGQKMAKEEKKRLLSRKRSKSPGVSGITSLWATKTPPAMSSKCSNPVFSVIGSSLVVTDRMLSRQTETTNHTKLNGPGRNSELTCKSPCGTEEVISPQKSPQCTEEEDELPATQPVASLLLKGITNLCIKL
jgi:hypothetical protein